MNGWRNDWGCGVCWLREGDRWKGKERMIHWAASCMGSWQCPLEGTDKFVCFAAGRALSERFGLTCVGHSRCSSLMGNTNCS